MNLAEKSAYLYGESARFRESGHSLVASELEKVADHFGREFIKEALSSSNSRAMFSTPYMMRYVR